MRSVWVTLGVVVGLTLAGCGGPDGGGDRVGTVVAGVRTDFSGLNPVTNTSLDTDQVLKYGLFTPLIRYGDAFEPEPYLAESWELHGDTAVTFILRDDVVWHDGEPVTAHDVEFTFDLAKAPETGSLIGGVYLAQVRSAVAVDDRTVTFRFTGPHAQALEDFWWAPLPRHLLEDVQPAQLVNAPYNRAPVGSGPFRFGEWRANDRLVLVPADSFPAALGGPAESRVVFRVIPEPATLLTELLTGGVHVDIAVEPDQAPRVSEADDLTLHSYPGTTLYYLGWNTQRSPFDDPRVRRAMTLAIDRQELIDGLLEGYGTRATSTVPPWHPYHPEIAPLPHDPARARSLLAEAGWMDGDGDGVRERDGSPLSFSILTSERPLNRSMVEAIQSRLAAVGATVEIRVLEFQTMLSLHRERAFDAVLSNWVLDNFQMAAAPYALFHSDQAGIPGSANRSGVRSARLDSLIEAGAVATDPAEAARVWRAFTVAVQEEQPFTFMFWLDELAASSDAVTGVEMDQRGEFRTLPRWRLR
ncbi:MAG: ABC transporter substrate-binding protein [Longimicrobiales bacterium]|nr:ABC transporter substrate-binding protein [Longimicrobiales bacterium]